MKLLVIGDFHGKFPEKLKKRAKEVDLVISLGDYPPWSLKKEFFKRYYGKDVELWEIIGKKKYKKFKILDFKKGKKIVERLNNLPVQVLSVLGNYDCSANDVMDEKKLRGKRFWKWDGDMWKYFEKLLKESKNIHNISYSYFKFKEWIFIGMRGHSFPGHVKSNAFKRHKKKLDDLFRKFKKENKEGKVIFVSHIAPYKTKLDKITSKEVPKKARGKHHGSKMTRRIIEKWRPVLNLSGHFHENQGQDKLGKTILVNPGAAVDGKAAIIDIDEKKGKVKGIKFLK